jgi:hypothetical protein
MFHLILLGMIGHVADPLFVPVFGMAVDVCTLQRQLAISEPGGPPMTTAVTFTFDLDDVFDWHRTYL